ncbi:MAG: alanine:cation symporter family protein [Lachnospiraceae bacterium]|nr:alanine:cation symporter family protein [Lachnospiraceae bacterium]
MNDVLTKMNDVMYTYILIVLLIGVGVYFTIKTKGVQFRLLKDGIKSMLEKTEEGADGEKKVSSFQALMISTASRVGTGNIAGIATAIVAGGPGAVFWMWVMALIGGASAFVESTLAQIYKVRADGQFRGGPSYYMERALGKRWMGILFSVLLIICFAYGFNGLQAYNMSSALSYYIEDYSNTIWPLVIGIILAVAAGYIIWGGTHRIGFISSVIVPVMAIVYILIGLITMLLHITELPQIFAMILKNAFDVRAMAGGFAGSAVVIGIKRGLFSNEAGMGSAPNASASAEVDHPVKQGLVQVISVFIDTILICSSTAMMLLVSGIDGQSGVFDGIPYVQAAISNNVGEWGIHFITVSIFAFAFSSLIGNYYYAESNILFIKNSKVLLFIFRATCLVAIFLGAQANFGLVWNIADITMGLMAIVNIIAIFLLSKVAFKVLAHYEEKKRQGENPVFYEDEVGLTGTVWKRDE